MLLKFTDFGYPVEVELINVEDGVLILGYLSEAESKRYMLQSEIDTSIALSIGTAPFGGVAIWSMDRLKSNIIKWIKAEPLLNQDDIADNDDLPPRDLFDNYMKQFTYRYMAVFERWNDNDGKWVKHEEDEMLPEFEYIEETLYDGTYDKLHDGALMKYHEAGKPKKLAIKWHQKKSEYSAYLWFDENGIRAVFDKFYGAHPDTKSDFIIKIDPENRRYELSLYRYGMKEPVTIPEEAYQLMVFKNKFEDYRSDNYSQESGAWIW